jgi:hypothetical protein
MGATRTIVEILLQAKDLTGRAFTGVLGRVRAFKDSIFNLRTAVAGFVAFVTTRVVGQIVAAFAKQEQAVIRLNTALRVTGRYTEDGTKKIQAMSEEMQRLTTVSDEAALGISATLAQLATGLTTDQLAEAQKAVIGLSEAFGIDLQSAATLVGKTLSGEMNALGRYGIRVDDTASQQQKFNQIVQQTARFFDVAVGATQSLIGQYAQAKNASGELLETFGQIIAETFNLTTEQGNLRDRINDVNERIKANLPEWVKWGKVIVAVAVAVVRTFGNVVRFFFNVGQVIGDVFVVLYEAARLNFAKAYNSAIGFINGLITGFNILNRTAIPLLTAMPEAAADALAEAKDRLLQDADDIRASIAGIGDAWSNVVKAIKAEPLPVATVATAGGGTNKPLSPGQLAAQAAQTTLGAANQTLQRFQGGGLSTGEFEAQMSRIVPQLQALRDSGLLSQDAWNQVTAAIEKFREEADKAGILITSLDDTASATFGQALAQRIHEASAALGTLNEQLATTTVDSMGAFMQASIEAFGAFTDGSHAAGQAFESAMLGALASVASMFAQMFAARATAALAEAILPSSILSGTSAGGLAAAGYFTAAALAMSALAGALRGAAARTAGGAGGGGGAAGAAARTSESAREGKEATVVIEGGLLDLSDPRQQEAFANMYKSLVSKGIVRITVKGA